MLFKAARKFRKEGKNPGLAIDLGAGKSFAARSLLEDHWEVIAIDNSESVIDEFCKVDSEEVMRHYIDTKQLTILKNDVEDFIFPQNVRLIHACDIFSYCNPSKMEKLWDEIYTALEKGGRLIGSFYLDSSNKERNEFMRLTGAWFMTEEAIAALLNEKGYKVEASEFIPSDIPPSQGGGAYYFMAKK